MGCKVDSLVSCIVAWKERTSIILRAGLGGGGVLLWYLIHTIINPFLNNVAQALLFGYHYWAVRRSFSN